MGIPLNWQVGHSSGREALPTEFVPATVPGAVQIDWGKAKGLPDWNWEENFEEYRWMEDCWWVYRAEIPPVRLQEGEQLVFRCGGIDYKYRVLFGGELLYSYEGMFRPFELDLTAYAAVGGELTVVIEPVPKAEGSVPGTRQEASRSCKPAVSYGWDWHPRLVPSGIWEETTLTVEPTNRILDAEVLYTLSEDLKVAELSVSVETQGEGADGLIFRLFGPEGGLVLETSDLSRPITVTNPQLWWCNGYGDPALYRWELDMLRNGEAVSGKSGRIGFRRITLEMNEGAWDEPKVFPMTRSNAPITLTINHIPIFAKGSNWVNPEIFPGTMGEDTYRPLLELAKGANMNLLRVWGGGIVNKDSFFDLCDEYGILVWQEFPLACNCYEGTPEYLAVLESEAAAIIRRLRSRACLAIWCGGNELFNSWSRMTDQSHALRMLNKLCYELDAETPFLPTSPVVGMAHGCYTFLYPDGREVYQAMAKAHYTAYTEFGMPSISNMETLLAATTRDKLFPLEQNSITTAHHAFDAWTEGDTWCGIETLRKYLGEPSSLEQMVEWSQWFQREGYKCIFEEARRQKPYCSMALNWCYNEPWPTIANNSLVNYPATPKPAYFAVKESSRNRLISARIPKFSWQPGEEFSADLWLLCDGVEGIEAGKGEVYLEYNGARHFLLRWDYPAVPANQNLAGPTVRHRFPKGERRSAGVAPLNAVGAAGERGEPTPLKLILSAGELSSEYTFLLYLQ
ncbi:MAG: glycoside hydrolase family 2 protein [Oscillospiraceae bacterium]